MHLRLGRLVRSLALAALAATSLTAVPSPARAAVPDPVFVQNFATFKCLEQLYFAAPSVEVRMKDCYVPRRRQQWGVHRVSSTSSLYRWINHDTGWCLSHPNVEPGSPIYAETCTNANKQYWILQARDEGGAIIINAHTGYCMVTQDAYEVRGHLCKPWSATDRWMWSTVPVIP